MGEVGGGGVVPNILIRFFVFTPQLCTGFADHYRSKTKNLYI
jgi:hypothetical protein